MTGTALGISVDDRNQVPVNPADIANITALGFSVNPDGTVPPIYVAPLTPAMKSALKADHRVTKVMKVPASEQVAMFPRRRIGGLDPRRLRRAMDSRQGNDNRPYAPHMGCV